MAPIARGGQATGEAARALNILMIGLEWFDDNPGGGGRYSTDAALGLAARGHRVTLVVPRQRADTPLREEVAGIKLVRWPWEGRRNKLLGAWRAIREVLPTQGPFDAVHAHFALYALLPLWHPALRGARRICQFQGPWAAESRIEGAGALSTALRFGIERLAYARCHHFITLSDAFKTLLARDYHLPAERISVIPAGIDTERFQPPSDRVALRAGLGIGDAPMLFVMRRLVRRMGLEVLLDAVALARARHPGLLLVVGGTGPLAAELQARALGLGLESAVRWTGRLSDDALVAHYQAADLTVVPTVALEGFGLVTVESLACGTPVLGTDEGGTAEILRPFDPDLLVPPGRPDLLADRLVALLSDPRPSREDCRRYALAHYAWPSVLERLERVLAGGD